MKDALRPILVPVLARFGWQPRASRVPFVSASERLQAEDVPTRVTVRDDQTILVNGAPFFPIGLYYAADAIADASGAGLTALHDMGFNLIFFDGGLDADPALDRIARAGLHVCYRPPGQLHGAFAQLKEIVSRFARHQAVLFWEMDDEPVLNRLSLAATQKGCQLVRALDTFHPIVCTQWLSGLHQIPELSRWAALADVNAFTVYPVPPSRWDERMSLVDARWPHSIAIVGAQTALWRSLAPTKPVIAVLQAWAPNCLEDGEAGFPSVQQSRFMAYQAVIRGAKGIHYYGSPAASSPNTACGIPPTLNEDLDATYADFVRAQHLNQAFWKQHARVINELSVMCGVFASRDEGATGRRGTEAARDGRSLGLEHRVKRHDDSLVVLVVNASTKPAPMNLQLPFEAGRLLNVWGENRCLPVRADRTADDVIESFGVRIYSDTPDLLASLARRSTEGVEDASHGFTAEKEPAGQMEAARSSRHSPQPHHR